MNRRQPTFLRCLLPIFLSGCVCAFGADDDIVIGEGIARSGGEPEIEDANQPKILVNEIKVQRVRVLGMQQIQARNDEQFEREIFGNGFSSQRARITVNSGLERIMTQLNHVCQLTDLQKQKLQQAGQVDRKHFFDRLDEVKRQCRGGKSAECQVEIQVLQIKTVTGILGSDSFFAKYVRRTLSKEQLAKLEGRRRSNRLSSIGLTLNELESVVKLEASQRDALSQLMLDDVPYPGDFEIFGPLLGDSEKMALKYHLSQMADEKVRPLLDPLQWDALQPHFQEFRSFRLDLTERGLIVFVADNAAAINPARAFKEQK